MEVIENDDYLSHAWTYLILRVGGSDHTEIVFNPSTSRVRLLFENYQFGDYTGKYYEDAVWVEPIPGKEHFAVKKTEEPSSTIAPTAPSVSKEYENLQYAYNQLKKESENLNKKLPSQDQWLIIHALLQLAEKSKPDDVVKFNGIQETLKLFITTNDIFLDDDDREEIEDVFEDYFK